MGFLIIVIMALLFFLPHVGKGDESPKETIVNKRVEKIVVAPYKSGKRSYYVQGYGPIRYHKLGKGQPWV